MIYKPKLPKRWNNDLAYLFGLLIGDGSLPNATSIRPSGKHQRRYLIYFVSNSIDFSKDIYFPLFKRLFGLKIRIDPVKNKKKPLYNCRIESKVVYLFLEKRGYITGRKAKIAKVPENMPARYNIYLLAGLLDTDGGKKGNGFGLSTASEYLARFYMKTLDKLKIPYHSCPWLHEGHIYHQIYTSKKQMAKILKTIPIKNKEKIEFLKSYMPR